MYIISQIVFWYYGILKQVIHCSTRKTLKISCSIFCFVNSQEFWDWIKAKITIKIYWYSVDIWFDTSSEKNFLIPEIPKIANC